jgi:hypothetical protein
MKLLLTLLITSTIICSKTKEPLAGVKVTGKDTVVYTDFDGKFTLPDDSVKINYISYQSEIVPNDSIIAIKFIMR